VPWRISDSLSPTGFHIQSRMLNKKNKVFRHIASWNLILGNKLSPLWGWYIAVLHKCRHNVWTLHTRNGICAWRAHSIYRSLFLSSAVYRHWNRSLSLIKQDHRVSENDTYSGILVMGVRLTSHWTAATFTSLLFVPGWGWEKGWMDERTFFFIFWKCGVHGGMILTGENLRTRYAAY
jgi:hypothetical protein